MFLLVFSSIFSFPIALPILKCVKETPGFSTLRYNRDDFIVFVTQAVGIGKMYQKHYKNANAKRMHVGFHSL